MPQKSGPNPAKSSRRDTSSAPEPLIIGEERVKVGQDDPNAPPIKVIGFAQTEKPVKPTQRQRIQALEAEVSSLRLENEQLVEVASRVNGDFYDFARRLSAIEARPVQLPAGESASYLADSNRRTRRYAVAAHDQVIEYVDRCFDRLIERTTPREEADELFERLQSVEQYIRADDALNHSFAYSNTENERAERRAWRAFRAAALDKIGRITKNYVRRD